MLVRARAPLRLGLAGGGTDVSPYCDTHGGYVLNAAIDRYAYAVIQTLEDPTLRFVATDQQDLVVCPLQAPLPLDGQLNLHKAVYNHIILHYNQGRPIALELSTFCERVDCGLQGGRQDQYSATFGGFNFMEFYANDQAIINSLRIKNWIICELEASLLLFYTGVSRESARIIADQSSNVRSGSLDAMTAMHGIKNEALVMKECLLKGDFQGIVDSMLLGWENKKRSAKTVSNPHIEEIYNAAIGAGALAGKVSGAGGGGFMMFFVPPEKRMEVVRALSHYDGQVSNCHFTRHGTQAWRV